MFMIGVMFVMMRMIVTMPMVLIVAGDANFVTMRSDESLDAKQPDHSQ